MEQIKSILPLWTQDWLAVIVPLVQVFLIALCAWLLRVAVQHMIERVCKRYRLPTDLAVGARRILVFLVYGGALLLILGRFGVSGGVLWAAFTGFAAVGAIAFFAAWSVLSNIFCALLILVTRPFGLRDKIELLEGGDKPGLRGRVIDINLIYTTLEEINDTLTGTTIQIPNSLFFSRITRRWQ